MDRARTDELIDLAYDYLLTRRVNELVDVDAILAGIDAVHEPSRAMRLLQKYLVPGRERVMARLAASRVKLNAWLPDLVREGLAAELGKPVKVPRKIVEEAVASERVRENVRTMMQEAIKDVIERAFKAAPGGGGVKGIIGLGARATRGMFGGIADEVQRGLADRINDVIDSGVALVQRRIVEKMTSEETGRQLGERRKQAFLKLLEQDEAAVAKFFSRTPWGMLDAVFPAVAAHNLQREEVRKHLRDEVAIVLAELSTEPLGVVLDELGIREVVRQSLHRHLPMLIEDFVATPGFGAWLAKG